MSGIKGKSGGARPGAGRPVATRTLRTGQELLLHEVTPDGLHMLSEMLTVTEMTHTQITLIKPDGTRVFLRL
jgi:hypothetical protein